MEKGYLKKLGKASLKMNFTLSPPSQIGRELGDQLLVDNSMFVNMGLDALVGGVAGYLTGNPNYVLSGIGCGIAYAGLKPLLCEIIKEK